MSFLRTMLAPVGAIGGPFVAGAIAACARALNPHRLRPLNPEEVTSLGPAFSPEELAGVRVAEHSRLPILPQFVAITLGDVIYVRGPLSALPATLLAHELAHVRQYRQLGWVGMTAAYGRLWIEHGYGGHPLEQEARAAELAVVLRKDSSRT